jgi:uncharacterized protein (DUF697 family)
LETDMSIESKGRMAAQVWRAFKELSPKGMAAEANRQVRLGVVGTAQQCQEVARFLIGDDPAAYDRAAEALLLMPAPLDASGLDMLPRCDALLVASDSHEVLPGVSADRVFRFESSSDLQSSLRDLLRSQQIAYAQIALARAFPGLRSEAAAATIQTVSVENTVFVVSTSLGNVIPNPLQPLAAVAETIGDVVVLTANQVRMLFRLAAIHDQPLGFKQQSREVMSVIAAPFGWRSIARELMGAMPLGMGIVPKAAIAFAGTWAVGEGIAFYNTTGRHMTKQELRERFEVAYEKGRATADTITGKIKEGIERGRARLLQRPDGSDN